MSKPKTQLLSGNDAIARGALAAGLNFFSGYPITPASEIMHTLVKTPINFIQAEDEIAAINICLGASLAGSKVMTATSGPGFSLMQETIGFAFKLETPLVVVDCQRVGPSTGMPTLGAQGDILQAKHGSHGDYLALVFSPDSVKECYQYTIESFNAAEEAKTPVILLVDGFLAHLYETVNLNKVKFLLKKRDFLPLGKAKRHLTGLTSQDNLPQTRDSSVYRQWYQKRKSQILKAAGKYSFFEYHQNQKSDTLLIAYGTTSRVISPLKEKYAVFRPIRLFPIIDQLKKIAQKYSRLVMVEANDGQYQNELEAFLKREVKLIAQLGGHLSLEEIKNELKKIN